MDSAQGGFNLNEDANDVDAEDEEVQEIRRMGHDKAKKKALSSSVRSESLTYAIHVDDLDVEDKEVQEVRRMGHDRAKKEAPSSSILSKSLTDVIRILVDMIVDKWKNIKSGIWGKRKEAQDSYIELKSRQLQLEEQKRQSEEEAYQEHRELKRERGLRTREKNLSCNVKCFHFNEKRIRIKTSSSIILLFRKQLEKMLKLKRQIKEI
ncbi:hypothetical protein Tco_0509120 [Tanacetum coccineum]